MPDYGQQVWEETVTAYLLIIVGVIAVVAFGIPLMERLVRRVWPMTPKQEEAEHFRRLARRSLDRFRRY